jgi:hypothetical protein
MWRRGGREGGRGRQGQSEQTYKILTTGELEKRVYESSFHYSYNLSISLTLFQNEK